MNRVLEKEGNAPASDWSNRSDGESLPPPDHSAECRLLLLPDGRLFAHNLTPELHALLTQLFVPH